MKRKVNLVGHSTHTVSLPKKWVKENGVLKGHELHVLENGSELIISTQSRDPSPRKISISFLGFQNPVINRIVAACYKAGYSELILEYENPSQLAIIQKTIENTYMGYDLEYLDNGKLRITSISDLDASKFYTIEKKFFQSVNQVILELLQSLSAGAAGVERITLMDKQVDMYSDYCRRLINQGYTEPDNIPIRYYMYEQLEIIADGYKDLVKKIGKDLVKYRQPIELTHTLYSGLFDLYFNFSLETASEFCILHDEIINDLEQQMQKSNGIALPMLLFLTKTIFECKSAIFTMRLQ